MNQTVSVSHQIDCQPAKGLKVGSICSRHFVPLLTSTVCKPGIFNSEHMPKVVATLYLSPALHDLILRN